jgi:hypothetical protein
MTSDLLKELALYLEGLKAGKGNILPLGQIHLEELWKVVKEYQALEREQPRMAKEKLTEE